MLPSFILQPLAISSYLGSLSCLEVVCVDAEIHQRVVFQEHFANLYNYYRATSVP